MVLSGLVKLFIGIGSIRNIYILLGDGFRVNHQPHLPTIYGIHNTHVHTYIIYICIAV